MKTIFYAILLSSSVIMIATSCEDQKDPAEPKISGSITDISDCKNFKSADLKFTEADTFSCIHYLYDDVNHKVIMTHINSGFNCCPGGLYCKVSTYNDTIIIKEFENEQGCDCNCLFDLDIELSGIDQKSYIMKFIEPYAEGQEELIFEMDLTVNIEGEYCVTRKGYPWGF